MWIEDYRKQYGLELDDMARRVNVAGRKLVPPLEGTVTDMLIHILEVSKVPRTHPRIADAIAMACKATAEQRDSIVDEKHRGTWKPQENDYSIAVVPEPVRDKSDYKFGSPRPVVQIDSHGYIIKRFCSIKSAAAYCGMNKDTITARCKHEISNEFAKNGSSFRYADTWDRMSRIEKMKDVGVDVGE